MELDITLSRAWLDVDSKLKTLSPYFTYWCIFHIYARCSWCSQCVHSHVHTLYADICRPVSLLLPVYIACFIWDPKPSPSATEEPRNRRQAVWPQPSVFWGNIWCMEDPPKIAHMDLVWLCWSCGKPKRSETQKICWCKQKSMESQWLETCPH